MRLLLALLLGFAFVAGLGLLIALIICEVVAFATGDGSADVPVPFVVAVWTVCGVAGSVWAWREDLR